MLWVWLEYLQGQVQEYNLEVNVVWVLSLILILVFSSSAYADAGLLQKTTKNAVFHVPWEGNTISWEFNKKDWGTWNILAVSVNKKYISSPTGTDWEYVYLAKPKEAVTADWLGGNHGNEVLKTLEFIVDGQVVKDGLYKVESNLVIKETTDLVYPVTKEIVGSVVRHYEVNLENPNRLDFSQKTIWHTDMDIDRAYICMLPIDKRYGRHFEMGNIKDSFANNIKTGNSKGWQHVTETFLYGDNSWGMIAGIDSLDSVDQYQYSKGGAFVWDLASNHVKLYYPKAYEMGWRPVLADTIWQSASYFIVVPVKN